MLVWFLLGMSAAVLTAESFSPQYHTTGEYADIAGVLRSLLFPIGALLLGAANNRFRRGRFTLTATLALTPLLWMGTLLTPALHLGILSFPPITLLFLMQILSLAGAAAILFPIGVITTLTLGCAFLLLILPGGAAWLPLDNLAYGGTVPLRTTMLLLPQALTTTAFFLWLGITLLYRKESV
jgi:hypothetical protein